MRQIAFRKMTYDDISMWNAWVLQDFIKETWFLEGYEPAHKIHEKIQGNGYDYPYIITTSNHAIGYIQCRDLYAYAQLCKNPPVKEADNKAGSFSIDLFIGEKEFLDKGFGTLLLSDFVHLVFTKHKAKTIFIDPALENKRAIRCYEKVGFEFIHNSFDGVCNCYVMSLSKSSWQKHLPAVIYAKQFADLP